MENPDADQPDDLEIASIGSLYVGPWDKKYWSCSRGKDRYPYPVGYRSIRTVADNICQMEVCEGLKGPLFVITAVDGSSFSGQTPDIAWENYQRSCSKVKSWGVKRFSNKIDGAELFGLKNPSVQRLLRELVNNVNMAQGGISFPPLFCNRSKSVDKTHPQVSDHDPSLVSALEEQDISRTRIRKKRNASKDTIREARPKKITNQALQTDSKTDALQQISDSYSLSPDNNAMRLTRKHIDSSYDEDSANVGIAIHQSTSPSGIVTPMTHVESSVLQYQKEVEIISFSNCNRIEASGLVMHVVGEVSHHSNLASNKVPMVLDCSESLVDKHIVSQQKSNYVETETYMATTGLDKSNGSIKIMFDRFSDADVEQKNRTPSAPKSDYGEVMALTSSSDVYISDTYDSALGKNCNGTSFDVSEVVISAFDSSNENPICIKDDLVAVNPLSKTSEHPLELVCKNESRGLTTGSKLCASEPSHLTPHDPFYRNCIPEDAIFQGVAKDSLPEVGSSGSSGRGVEEVDLNLAGQELAKSMMAFLLPQAVPLLKETYVRRRSRIRLLKAIDPCCTLTSVNTPDPNAVNDHLNSIIHQGTDIVAAGGKLLPGTLTQLPEKTILKSINASKSSSQAAGFTEFNLHLANEPFSGDTSSKDPMTVIPDSFENDMRSYDASMKEQLFTGFDEPDLALQDNVKGNSDTSSLPITVVEEVNKLLKCFSQNDAYNQEAVTPDKKDGLVNSIITVVQPDKHILPAEETNEESMKSIEKYSNNLTETFSSLDAAFFIQNSFQHFNQESEHNAEEVSFQVSPGKCPYKDDNFEQNPPGPCHILNNLNDNDVSKEVFGRCDTFRPTKEKSRSFCPVEVVNFDMHKNNKVEQIREDNHSLPCMTKYMLVTGGIPVDTIEAQNCNSMLSIPYNAPLSETILCRNLNNSNASDMDFSRKSTFTAENYHSSHINHNADSRTPSVYEAEIDGPKNKLRNDPYASELESNWIIAAAVAFQSQNLDRNAARSVEVANETDNGHKDLSHGVFYKGSLFDGSLPRELYDGGRFLELVGCYSHPEPILSVTLSTNMNQLQLSVLCGFPEETNRILFMYSVSLQKLRGCPTFLGYTPLLLPAARNRWNINIPFERSALQLTPDHQFLIFVSSIKAPRCRERKISCLCSNCKTESSIGMTIEIVHVNFGYVSRMTKLTTVSNISCISVCEPSYLIAVEEDGRLHAWVMNLTWSENLEEFMLPTLDCVSPRILELKGIPNCNSLIVGHNGLGDFGLWELSKRVLVAKFSSPKSTIYQIIPVYVFNWQMNSTFSTGPQSADHNMDIIHQTNYKISLGSSFENIAIWILISAADFASKTRVKGLGTDHTGFWRLALMTKNTLIMGNSLDPRATAVDASANNGIIGTSDGLFYKWELSSGRKLGNLTSINCGVACVALDGKTGAVAVAGKDGRLQVFV